MDLLGNPRSGDTERIGAHPRDAAGISRFRYGESPFLPIAESSPELTALERTPGATVVAPRLNFAGLVAHGDTTLSVLGEGVDPQREKLVSRVLQITEGEALSADDPHGILLGQGLAKNLGCSIGDTVVLLATTKSGGINAVEGRVRGFFSTEAKAYDDVAIRLPISLARELLHVAGSNVWVIALDSTDRTADFLNTFRQGSEAPGCSSPHGSSCPISTTRPSR